MKLAINIEEDIFEQFHKQLNAKLESNVLHLQSSYGEGKINMLRFPNSIEFYHFKYRLKQEIELNSMNPEHSDYYLLNINLSEKEVKKNINGQEISFQKHLPSGILFYPPKIKIASKGPIHSNFEIVLIKFHKDLITTYFKNEESIFQEMVGTIVYEDLDAQSEKLLNKISTTSNKLKSHSNLLAFLSIFFEKLKKREKGLVYENLHPQDIKQLFIAASLLRNPIVVQIPTVEELAKVANMGKTKFKNKFKQIFGLPPKQYHQKIKMEYAKDMLLSQSKNSSEIAYELGYAHPSKFTRAFKNYFGEVPSKLS